MKKLFSFVVAVMMSAIMFGATQYCQELLEAQDGTALLSLKHVSGNSYVIEFVAKDGMKFTGVQNINCGVNQSQGPGIVFSNNQETDNGWEFSSDGLTATFAFQTASEASVPTSLYANYICLKKSGGTTSRDLVEFSLASITDIDWTTTCPEKEADEEAPVMQSASVASVSYTSVTLKVSATDNVGVRRYHVVTTGVDKDFTPSNDQIEVTGLTAATTYSFTVTAKDAAGNESANSIVVENVKTLTYPAAPAAPTKSQADVRSIYSDTYTSALAHDFSKNTWSGISYSEVTLDDNNHYLLYTTTNVNWIAWGNTDGDNAIIAAEGYNDGTNKGLDLSAMEYLHIDIFADADFVSGEVNINDVKLAGLGTVKGGEWNSLDLPLSNLETAKLSNTCWLKFVGLNGINMVLIDNVYAWKENKEEDTEKPVMKTATLVTKTYNKAVISVTATDNVGVAKYHVVDAENKIDAKYTATDGNITVTGLTPSTSYNFTITAIDLVGNESENSATVEVTTPEHKTAPEAAPTAPTYPANQVKAIYSATYNADCNFGEWSSNTTYTQDTYGKKFVTTERGYFGLEGFALNCSSMEALHLDIWCEEDMTLDIFSIGDKEMGITKSVKGEQWNGIDISLSEFTEIKDWTNIKQLKIANAPSKTFWLNNVYFYTTQKPAKDEEAPTDFTASVDAISYVSVNIKAQATDNSGAVIFQVFNSDRMLTSQTAASAKETVFTVSNLAAGTEYTLTVKAVDESGNIATNTQPLTFTTKALPTPATAPTAAAEDVQSVYSDAYTPAVTRTMGQWEQKTIETEVALAEGDKALLYTTCDYLGWENVTIDATNTPNLHIDIYVETESTIQFTPIWKNAEGKTAEAVKTYTLVAGWNSLAIDLKADFAGIDLATIFQMKWAEMPNTCFIDNVYFYKSGTSTLVPAAETLAPAQKLIENGQVIILRDGIRYNAMGQRLQ